MLAFSVSPLHLPHRKTSHPARRDPLRRQLHPPSPSPFHRITTHHNRNRSCPLSFPTRSPTYAQHQSPVHPPSDPSFVEVRVLSLGPSRNDGSLLTLLPVAKPDPDHAFKMAITATQADSIRNALATSAYRSSSCNVCDNIALTRPGTHDFLANMLNAANVFITTVAITGIVDDVFVARVWFRHPEVLASSFSSDPEDSVVAHDPDTTLEAHQDDYQQPQQLQLSVDARPSDAIAMAVRCAAPIYLHVDLLEKWNILVSTVHHDAQHGHCHLVTYDDSRKTASSMRAEFAAAPEYIALAKLKMKLDLAVRLERFQEAAILKRKIASLCPIDTLKQQLDDALRAERFAEAANIQDQIVVWKARLRMWERAEDPSSVDHEEMM